MHTLGVHQAAMSLGANVRAMTKMSWRGTPALAIATGLLGAIAPAFAATKDAGAADSNTLTITLSGDVGLNPTNQTVDPKGVNDGGFQTWADTTANIAPYINGDLNFMNVETVVTDRNDLPPDGSVNLTHLGFIQAIGFVDFKDVMLSNLR